jgi:hypothetical protein
MVELVTGDFFSMKDLIIAGIVSGLTTGIILGVFAWFWQRWVRFTNTEEFKITLIIPSTMYGLEFKFGVLHASNDNGIMINRVHWFRKKGVDKLRTVIRHPRNIGFQYKCFVDFGFSYRSDEVINFLSQKGYKEPNLGKGNPRRVWFILPDKPTTAAHPGGPNNNHYYPQ